MRSWTKLWPHSVSTDLRRTPGKKKLATADETLALTKNRHQFVWRSYNNTRLDLHPVSLTPPWYKIIGLTNFFGAICPQTIHLTQQHRVYSLPLLTESKFTPHPTKQMKSFEFSKSQESTKVLSNGFDLLLDDKQPSTVHFISLRWRLSRVYYRRLGRLALSKS